MSYPIPLVFSFLVAVHVDLEQYATHFFHTTLYIHILHIMHELELSDESTMPHRHHPEL
jgi:hypothetical protein